MSEAFDIEKVDWSPPRVIQTRHGDKQVRTWRVPNGCNAFWDQWRRGNLRQRGYSVSKYNGHWEVTQWRDAGGNMTDEQRGSEQAAQTIDEHESKLEHVSADAELPATLAARFEEVERIYDDIERETGNDYRYQLPAIKWLSLCVDAYDSALDASDTGTGKTPIACGVAKTLGRNLLVVCPKAIILPWKRMARRFGVMSTVINYEMLRTGRTLIGEWNPERKRQFVYNTNAIDPEATLFVFDECHRMKDYRTKNCALGIAALSAGFKTIGLSATAADNPMHMKFTSLLTGLIQHPAHFFGWMTRNGVTKGRWGYEFTGGRNVLRNIHRQIFPVRGSRIRIADLGDRFPETQIEAMAVELVDADKNLAAQAGVRTNDSTRAIETIYRDMREEIEELEATEAKDRGANILTAILRARQRCELMKVPTFVQMAQDAINDGAVAIIALNFDASVHAVALRLETTATITGSDDINERQQLVDDFNDDQIPALVVNIKAGGLAISLHGKQNGKTRYVLISPTYSGIDLKQMLGRAHRAGGAHSIQKILFAAGTIEETACERVQAKIRRIDTINDGDLDIAQTPRPHS